MTFKNKCHTLELNLYFSTHPHQQTLLVEHSTMSKSTLDYFNNMCQSVGEGGLGEHHV